MVKEELNSEEKFFEKAVITEKFVKKYKNIMITTLSVIVIGVGASIAYDINKKSTIEKANNSLSILQKDGSNSKEIQTLKQLSPNLHDVWLYSKAIADKDSSLLKKLQDSTNLRAFADSVALKIKYTDKKIYLENEPKGSMSKALYAIAEKIRYEKIGSNKLKGVKNNITQCYENKFKKKRIEEIKTEADVPVTEAFELYLRNHFFKIKQNQATKKILSYWKKLFDKNLSSKLTQLDNCIENQSTYSHLVANLIANLGLPCRT